MVRLAVLGACLVALMGCSRAESAKKEPKEELHTYTVSSERIHTSIDATGMVQADLEGGAKILSPLAGAVQEIFVRVGDAVRKGDRLAAIRSSDAADVYSAYLSATSQLKQAERTYQLNKELFAAGAVTKNDLLNSEAAYEQQKSQNEGLRKKLEIYGSPSPEKGVSDIVELKAPIDGRVVDLQAHIGDRFDTSTAVMTIANPRKIVIVANVFDTDLPSLKKGSEVSFTTDVFPDRTLRGAISGISDIEDQDSKTVKVYIKPLNGTDLLKQNMFVKISFRSEGATLPTVPKTALIYRDGRFFVRLKNRGRDDYDVVEVTPVRDVSDKLMAVRGVRDRDEIVYSAIDLEKT
jgi:cobalt-zinc-cadmium efflux system membrane fusion protein